MGLCSCLASCLAWGVQHWSLLAVGWSWVLVLRWKSLGELSLIDITWGQEVSDGPMSWTRLSHLRGSGLTPGQCTKTPSATRLLTNMRNMSSLNCWTRLRCCLWSVILVRIFHNQLWLYVCIFNFVFWNSFRLREQLQREHTTTHLIQFPPKLTPWRNRMQLSKLHVAVTKAIDFPGFQSFHECLFSGPGSDPASHMPLAVMYP